jgi:hypothetical protein
MGMKHVKLFEQFLSEEYTRGEKAALAAGKDLLDRGPAAVAYCAAKGKGNKERAGKVEYLKLSGLRDIPEERWHEYAGIKKMSFVRAVSKFDKMLDGVLDDPSEVIYDKVKKYFEEFEKMPAEEIADIAADWIATEHVNKGDKSIDRVLQANIYNDVMTFSKLYKGDMQKAFKRTAADRGVSPEKVQQVYKKMQA